VLASTPAADPFAGGETKDENRRLYAALLRAGVAVRGVLDGQRGNQRWGATRGLVEAGCTIHLARRIGGLNKLHHKLMVIDRQVVIAGSFNYTEPATKLNAENIVVIGNFHEEDPDVRARQGMIADYALAEIDRVIVAHGGAALAPQ
jgi:phosphatidylserine/phosphatidylglycerophosphate/cardiolipin synthase-like enzyme